VLENATDFMFAARASESIWPAGLFQCHFTLRFGAKALYKFGQRQASLKLNAINCHGTSPDSLREEGFNQFSTLTAVS
jgi:hypothetical protein